MRSNAWIALLLALAVAAIFGQSLGFEFIHFDDPGYVTENRRVQGGLSWENAVWAFGTGRETTWQPLVWLSFMLDHAIWGLDPTGFHATNVALHAANAVLLFLVLNALTGARWAAAFAAALFALHPLRVEAVAWVTSRKDVLSTFFGLLSIAAYAGYARRGGLGRYLLVAIPLALGLMAKAMLVTLPLVFLLLDYWPLGRGARSRRRLVLEKLPLLGLSAAASLVAVLVQAVPTTGALPLELRAANAVVAYARYLELFVWPAGLSILYPHPYLPSVGGRPLTASAIGVSALVLAAVSAAVFASRRPYAITGWLWFLGTLVPVIGVVPIGNHALADRFTYVPAMGLGLALAFAGAELAARRPRARPALAALGIASLAAFGAATYVQLGYWRDSRTLFERALALEPRNAMIRFALGVTLHSEGDLEGAIEQYREVLEVDPRSFDALTNIGNALTTMGKLDLAIRYYRRAVRIAPDRPIAHYDLAHALRLRGDVDAAIEEYRRALRLSPDDVASHTGLGIALRQRGERSRAIRHFERALRQDPTHAPAHYNLAEALLESRRFGKSIFHFRVAVRLDPDHPRARRGLRRAQRLRKQAEEEVEKAEADAAGTPP